MLLLPNISQAFLLIKLFYIYSDDFQFQLSGNITRINEPEQFGTAPLNAPPRFLL